VPRLASSTIPPSSHRAFRLSRWRDAVREYDQKTAVVMARYPTADGLLAVLEERGFNVDGLVKEGEDATTLASEVSVYTHLT
jgi:hypothetical protein